jgi:tetratricopeptide (TPR) repeat protein
MMKKYILVCLTILFFASYAFGAGSSSIPSVSSEIKAYNKGVKHMFAKKFAKAEKQFRKAIAKKERFAEAHNNLAYVLRKQGPQFFEEALIHYNRAIEIKPNLAEAYMYRGVLRVQMGDMQMAKKDHERLKTLNPDLATELQFVITNGREKEPEQFFGVTRNI